MDRGMKQFRLPAWLQAKTPAGSSRHGKIHGMFDRTSLSSSHANANVNLDAMAAELGSCTGVRLQICCRSNATDLEKARRQRDALTHKVDELERKHASLKCAEQATRLASTMRAASAASGSRATARKATKPRATAPKAPSASKSKKNVMTTSDFFRKIAQHY